MKHAGRQFAAPHPAPARVTAWTLPALRRVATRSIVAAAAAAVTIVIVAVADARQLSDDPPAHLVAAPARQAVAAPAVPSTPEPPAAAPKPRPAPARVEPVVARQPGTGNRAAPAAMRGAISALAADGIPAVALQAYRDSATRSRKTDPSCGLPWPLLAAIGRVESDHGRFADSVLYTDGTSAPPIIGIPLNGLGTEVIVDTDRGRLDGDRVYDRAVGPMQFIPSTWAAYGADGNGDRLSDPFNIFDAAAAAGHYLCTAGGNLRTTAGQTAAVLAYNHSTSYLSSVLALEASYATGSPAVIVDVTGRAPARLHIPALPPVDPGPPPALEPSRPRRPAPPTTPAPTPAASLAPTLASDCAVTPSSTAPPTTNPTAPPTAPTPDLISSPSGAGSPSPSQPTGPSQAANATSPSPSDPATASNAVSPTVPSPSAAPTPPAPADCTPP